MAWTYSGDPSASGRDWVRWRIGDTDTSDQLLADAEIDAAVSEYGNKRKAAAECARSIASKFSRQVDAQVGDLRWTSSQKSMQYMALAEKLEAEISKRVKPFAGGISKSRKDSVQDDSDRTVPAFSKEQFDHPGTFNIESQSTS